VIGTTSSRPTTPAIRASKPGGDAHPRRSRSDDAGVSRPRILRAWAACPLYDPGGEGREAKRTFTVLDHAATDSIEGLISVLGGKLTTYRLMAEKVSDAACARLGVGTPCTTAATVLPPVHEKAPHWHHLSDRLSALNTYARTSAKPAN